MLFHVDDDGGLTREQGLARLARHRVGHLAYTERALPAIRSVPYAVVGTHVVLCPPDRALARRLEGQVLAFSVEDGEGSVVVIGTATLLDRSPWPAGDSGPALALDSDVARWQCVPRAAVRA